jgi:predicted transcriptional regulator
MRPPKINDRKLIDLIDKQGYSQAKAAKELGVSRQAVNQRLQELRGKTTKVVATKKVEQIVDRKIDAMEQLADINEHASWLLEHVMKWIKGDETAIQVLEKNARLVNVGTKEDPEYVTEYKFKDPHEIALKAMGEIRGQLKLQLEIFQALYDLKAMAEFQEEVLAAIGEASPEVRSAIISSLNQRRAIRSAVRFTESTVRG